MAEGRLWAPYRAARRALVGGRSTHRALDGAAAKRTASVLHNHAAATPAPPRLTPPLVAPLAALRQVSAAALSAAGPSPPAHGSRAPLCGHALLARAYAPVALVFLLARARPWRPLLRRSVVLACQPLHTRVFSLPFVAWCRRPALAAPVDNGRADPASSHKPYPQLDPSPPRPTRRRRRQTTGQPASPPAVPPPPSVAHTPQRAAVMPAMHRAAATKDAPLACGGTGTVAAPPRRCRAWRRCRRGIHQPDAAALVGAPAGGEKNKKKKNSGQPHGPP